MKNIKSKIENLRQELQEVAKNKETTNDLEVLTASKILDGVLNEYHQSLKRNAKLRKHRLNKLFDKRSGSKK